jgi:epoxyqueuosine reductase
VGKHSNLINRETGSFFFLAELIVDLELDYDGPVKDYCGTCTRCLDACPTAPSPNPTWWTAASASPTSPSNSRSRFPTRSRASSTTGSFGCDICQDVCPWNRFSKPHQEPQFDPNSGLLEMKKADWEEITAEVFKQVFKNSAVKRTKLEGLKRNIRFVQDQPGTA